MIDFNLPPLEGDRGGGQKRVEFIQALKSNLPSSNNADRDVWVKKIINEEIPIPELIPLLSLDFKIASRMLWLCSQIAIVDPSYLRPHLWTIYKAFKENNIQGGEASIANQWLICGIPTDHESEAIDILFEWLGSSKMNDTTKSRARKALVKVAENYPHIKNELELYLENHPPPAAPPSREEE